LSGVRPIDRSMPASGPLTARRLDMQVVEHDILMLDPRRAARLARHLVRMKKTPPARRART
jgi:hypothetical protein